MQYLNGLFVLDKEASERVFGVPEFREIHELVSIRALPMTQSELLQDRSILSGVDVLITGWGAPLIDEEFLEQAPNLKAIFHAAGAIGSFITPAVFERGIKVTTAYVANGVPVAEYALATILFSLKHGWALARNSRRTRTFMPRDGAPGCYGSTVGLISIGATGKTLLNLLQPFDLRVLVYDPYVSDLEVAELGVERVSLQRIFEQSDVVSLHTPLLAETRGLISGDHLASMKPGATFINTARGEIVRQTEMISVARERPDLQFLLDVTDPEPLPADSPLWDLPNVLITPHIAGSVGKECRRLGRLIVDELRRFVNGQPLKWEVTPTLAATSSHRLIHTNGAKKLHLAAHQQVVPTV